MAAIVTGVTLALMLALGPGGGSGGGSGVGAPEDGVRFSPPPIEYGYDHHEDWNNLWRRFQDRHGRPDSRGALLQPAPELQHDEYELTLAVARHPLYLNRDWNMRTRGARVFLHSDDEFSFFNGIRVKERIPMGQVGALGLRYDRLQLREVSSSMFQMVFAFPDIGGSGAFIELRPIARFEKPDVDVELAVGWARAGRGRIQARIFSLDTFNDASDAIAAGRGRVRARRVVQREPSFGLAIEAELFAVRNIRAAAYAGGVFPTRESFYYDDADELDIEREQKALLGGGWLEWAVPHSPVLLGGNATIVETRQEDHDFAGGLIHLIRERESRARVFALAHLDDESIQGFHGSLTLELVGSYRLTELPEHVSEDGSILRDRSWLGFVRANWMPTRVFGLELGYFVLDRVASGKSELAQYLSGANHRLSTRVALAFNPHVQITIGVGWDLDERGKPYDQGGMTLTGRW